MKTHPAFNRLATIRIMISHNAVFFARWIRSPRSLGSVIPSGPALAKAMARAALETMAPNGTVVELGAGTGVVTSALLEAGLHPSELVAIERDAALSQLLRRHLPHVEVVTGDATQIRSLLKCRGISAPRSILSCLPLLSLPDHVGEEIIRQAWDVLADGGVIIQFTYGLLCPFPREVLAELGIRAKRLHMVWKNIPPATLWQLSKPCRLAAAA